MIRTSRVAALLLVTAIALPASARCGAPVERLFAALGRHDFKAALAQTSGAAAATLGGMLGSIDREAAKANAQVVLDVRDLHVSEGAADADGMVPVDVRYDIALVGKRSIFRRLVRHLTGTARIVVDRASERIVSLGDFAG
jgi:hypothetical protein